MQPVNLPRRDPAPSRISYRIQRLWLTPFFRGMLRIGLPIFAVVLAVGWYFNDAQNRIDLADKVSELRRSIEERPEFMVKLMAIDGATEEIANDIREIVPVDFPISSFDLDLAGMQDTIEQLDAVARVDIHIRTGGILQIQISERIPAVVWRSSTELALLDASGRRVAAIKSRLDRADLPLLAGDGVEPHVAQALEILTAAEPVADRIRGLVRVGERRWDLVLDRDQRIMLPEKRPIYALEQVMALEQAQDLLDRDLIAVDMRNENRPTLRMAPSAIEELRRIRATLPGEIEQ